MGYRTTTIRPVEILTTDNRICRPLVTGFCGFSLQVPESFFVPFPMHHLTWGWDETTDALRWTSPFVSVALFAIGIVRYFRDDMSSQSRRSVRRSIAAYAIHLLVTVVPFIDSRMAHSVLSDIFVWASLLRLPVLIASIYFGFRSRATAGRRIAFAGISAMALPWVYGGRITARQDYSNVWPPI